ncbi:MerR family DNA-binding transcriptional regulator [Paenibacillus riograndensis]|nr:MerR family DNA-binding transcriptional regulator [Paenibacillus riograndensis]
MRIGDLTERAGVTQRTVRYYKSIGLLPLGEREGTLTGRSTRNS